MLGSDSSAASTLQGVLQRPLPLLPVVLPGEPEFLDLREPCFPLEGQSSFKSSHSGEGACNGVSDKVEDQVQGRGRTL